MPTFYLVELFSGSSSVARGARAALPPNWKMRVHSVDIHPKYNPTTATDISTWHYKPVLDEFLAKAGDKDVVWVHASPPCTEYSKAKTTAPRDLPLADSLVKRSLKIIKHVDPDFWSIENPVGLMRTRPFMQKLEPYRHSTSYCRFGKPFRKDTDIWTNAAGLDLPQCRQATPCPIKAEHGRHLVSAQAGDKGNMKGSGGGENVYPLPKKLVGTLVRSALTHGSV